MRTDSSTSPTLARTPLVTRKSKSYWIGTQFYVENDEGVSVVIG